MIHQQPSYSRRSLCPGSPAQGKCAVTCTTFKNPRTHNTSSQIHRLATTLPHGPNLLFLTPPILRCRIRPPSRITNQHSLQSNPPISPSSTSRSQSGTIYVHYQTQVRMFSVIQIRARLIDVGRMKSLPKNPSSNPIQAPPDTPGILLQPSIEAKQRY